MIGAVFPALLPAIEVLGALTAGLGGWATADAGCGALRALAAGDLYGFGHNAVNFLGGLAGFKTMGGGPPQARPTTPGRLASGSQKAIPGAASSQAGKAGGGTSGAPKAPHVGETTPPPCGNNSASRTGSGCFLAGTLVLTTDGVKPIERIQEGDQVFSRDEVTGATGYRTVTKLNRGRAVYVCKVVVRSRPPGRTEHHSVGQAAGEEGADSEPPSASTSDAQELLCTRDHPFWSATRGRWIDADALVEGEQLLDEQGRPLWVERIRFWGQQTKTYNFEVEGLHTYFVSESEGEPGVWVHNGGPPDQPRVDGMYASTPHSGRLGRAELYPANYRADTHAAMLKKHGVGDVRHLGVQPPSGSMLDAKGNTLIPSRPGVRGTLTYEHSTSVVEHYNTEGWNQTRAERNNWFNAHEKLKPMRQSENSAGGGRMTEQFRQDTGPRWTRTCN